MTNSKKKRLSRRSFLMTGTAATAAIGTGAYFLYPRATLAGSHGLGNNPLKIPVVDTGRIENGVRVYDLTAQNGETEFFPGLKTKTMGINASFLGSTLRMREGEDVQIRVKNELGTQTTLHWHGFNLPAAADGGPHQIIEPATVWAPEFTVRQKASSCWYHSHLMGHTADQVWAGLAGVIIVDDEESDALDLPRNYGIDDIPVVLQDRFFWTDGSMPYELSMHSRMMGMAGDTPLVNGTVAPYFDVSTSLVRLRLLNGSNASIYNLGFDDGRPFDMIATDGGFLNAPVRLESVQLAPGERAEIVVDMSDGRTTMLRSFGASMTGNESGNNSGGAQRGMGGMMGEVSPDFDFLELRPTADLEVSPTLATSLTNLPEVSADDAVRTRGFLLEMQGGMMGGFWINRKTMDINVINEVINVGETEIWEIGNASPMPHPFHIHNTQFRILNRDGNPPHASEVGFKDTVLVNPGERVQIIIRFDHYTDPDLPYMYHCHILEHEDGGMMGQFVVV